MKVKWSELTYREKVKVLRTFGLSDREANEQAEAKKIRDLPVELRDVASEYVRKTERTYAMPGDIVQVGATDDCLIPIGARGVIQGVVGERQPEYEVLFNWCPFPWWDKGVVGSSGGPSRIIGARELKFTGKTVRQDFHYFPGLPAANSAKIRTHRVSLWTVDLS